MLTVDVQIRFLAHPYVITDTNIVCDNVTDGRNVNDERGYAGARREPAARAARRPTPRDVITTRKAGAGSVSRRSARSDESTHHLLAIAEFDDNASAAPQQPHALGLSPLHTNQQPICSVTTSMTSPFCITDLTPLRSIKHRWA